MNQEEIHQFLVDFFTANECEIFENSEGRLLVKLSIELDKQLMNRSFYWYYLEKIGQIPEASTLSLVTRAERMVTKDDEYIHFGSPRLQKILAICGEEGKQIRLYENKQEALYPWLGMNVLISYRCNVQKTDFFSFGLNLLTGEIVIEFVEKLEMLALTPKIPDLSYTLFPFITIRSGIKRIENIIEQIARDETSLTKWSEKAYERLNLDLQLLECFYENTEKTVEYEQEYEAIHKLYTPYINVKVINGGIFYLATKSFV